MRVLLDECVPAAFGRYLAEHEVHHVTRLGWSGIQNGALLRRAASQFDVVVTVDQGMEHQQNIPAQLAVLCIAVGSTKIEDLAAYADAVHGALLDAKPGRVITISASRREP